VDEPTPLVTAVIVALAGVRMNQSVLVVGPSLTIRKALSAGCGRELVTEGPADVVVALTGPDVPDAVLQLAPGGRLVSIAADGGAVERTVARYGLRLQHMEAVAGRTAWSAQRLS
jgi:NADPH:quinone reductase-like Zn-dependent oxidoreductase